MAASPAEALALRTPAPAVMEPFQFALVGGGFINAPSTVAEIEHFHLMKDKHRQTRKNKHIGHILAAARAPHTGVLCKG